MIRTVVHYVDPDTYGGCEEVVLLLLSGLDKTRWRPILIHHEAPGIARLLKRSQTTRDLVPCGADHDRPQPGCDASPVRGGAAGCRTDDIPRALELAAWLPLRSGCRQDQSCSRDCRHLASLRPRCARAVRLAEAVGPGRHDRPVHCGLKSGEGRSMQGFGHPGLEGASRAQWHPADSI